MTLVSFFNPGLIVIGGGVAGLGHTLLAEIRSSIYRQSRLVATDNDPVKLSASHENRHHDPARSAAALFGAASLVTAIGLLLPHVSQVDEGGLVFVSAAAGAVAVILMLGRNRIPLACSPLIALTGTVLVSFSLYFNGERHGGPAGGDEMYFLWIVLWAAFHLRRRALHTTRSPPQTQHDSNAR